MELREYFEKNEGKAILSTADGDGKVDAAVYARPHFLDDDTIALIMRDRLTHHNLQFLYNMMTDARSAIREGRFLKFKEEFLERFRGKV